MINQACSDPKLRTKLKEFYATLNQIHNDSEFFYKGITPQTLWTDIELLEQKSQRLSNAGKNKHSFAAWTEIQEEVYPLIRAVRPYCDVDDCTRKAQNVGHKRKDGSIIYRINSEIGYLCVKHHNNFYNIHKRPYHKYRLDYCENIDSRLGYKCTTTIMIQAQLTVDHIDGNPKNNEPENLQTLCACCHTYKSFIYEDWKTPGRKALGVR